MTERRSSPEQLIEKMKISTPVTWITLFLLAAMLCAGLAVLFTQRVVLKEDHPCFVTGKTERADQTLLEIYRGSGVHEDYTIDTIRRLYGERVNNLAQQAVLVIEDIENSEISEGTEVTVDSRLGYVAVLPADRMAYADLTRLGVTDDLLIRAKLVPGRSYHIALVLIPLENEADALPPALYASSVLLDELDARSFIFGNGE